MSGTFEELGVLKFKTLAGPFSRVFLSARTVAKRRGTFSWAGSPASNAGNPLGGIRLGPRDLAWANALLSVGTVPQVAQGSPQAHVPGQELALSARAGLLDPSRSRTGRRSRPECTIDSWWTGVVRIRCVPTH